MIHFYTRNVAQHTPGNIFYYLLYYTLFSKAYKHNHCYSFCLLAFCCYSPNRFNNYTETFFSELKRSGTTMQKIRFAALDIAVGVVSGNFVAYFIIVTTATTLFHNPHHHGGITSAADAAQALYTGCPSTTLLLFR